MLTNLGRLPGVFASGESQIPGDEYTDDSPMMNTPGSLDSLTVNTPESITSSNNSSNIRKNSKSFLGVFNGTRRRCLMKKTRVKKSRNTLPLIIIGRNITENVETYVFGSKLSDLGTDERSLTFGTVATTSKLFSMEVPVGLNVGSNWVTRI